MNLMQRFTDHGVTLNKAKCVFDVKEVEFLGHCITPEGIQPIRTKLDAITDFKIPVNITQLRSFLGMAQQLSKFSPKLAQAAQPLCDLLSTKSACLWTDNHTEAFNQVKTVLTKPPILAHCDLKKDTKIRTDGSLLNGVSVIVFQLHGDQWKAVDCASRFLTPTEQNYHPIEMEMLAITWGCHRMDKYIHGLQHFIIETDHKPLIPILNTRSLLDMSPRIQRMRMKLLRFRFTAKHIAGIKITLMQMRSLVHQSHNQL